MVANKSWTITAVSHAGTTLEFHRQNQTLFSGSEVAPISPVEYLLIGAAGCLALSCRAVLAKRRESAVSVEVTAKGEKSADPPSRLRHIALAVRIGSEIDDVAAATIIAEAEQLCTVTNTLLGSLAIDIHLVRGSPDEKAGSEGWYLKK